MKTSEVLNIAADLLQIRGWTRGEWNVEDDQAPLCLEGAIAVARGQETYAGAPAGDFYRCEPTAAMQQYLSRPNPYLFPWNDHPGRTKEEVIEVLRAAALIEAAKEEADAEVKVEVSA